MKIQYFNLEGFIDAIIAELHADANDEQLLADLRLSIGNLLRQRLIATVVESLNDRELTLLEQMEDDHPELSDLDALMMTLHDVDGIKARLTDTINELHQELAGYARDLYMVKMAMTE